MLDKFKFDHHNDNFPEALGFSDRDYEVAGSTIMYEMLAPIVLAMDEDTDNDDPTLTRSAIFERVITRLAPYPDRQLLATLTYLTTHQDIKKKMKEYRKLLDGAEDGKFDFMKDGKPGRLRIEGAEELSDILKHIDMMIKVRPFAKAIELLKDSNCNYDHFIAFTVDHYPFSDCISGNYTLGVQHQDEDEEKKEEKSKRSYDDIDDIIKRALSQRDEDDE